MRHRNTSLLTLVLTAAAWGCSSDDSGTKTGASCASFTSTYGAIQSQIFERRGCTNDACHGKAREGALDLRAGASWESLHEVKAEGSPLARVQPGAPKESYLYLKLAAATYPDGKHEIANSPMPVGLPPLSEDELEAVRLWILGGASETGTVGDPSSGGASEPIARLLNACLPEATPIQVAPLEAPPAGEGIQFVSPPWVLAPGAEREVCVATYYDFSDRIPDEFKSPDGTKFYTNGSRLRQDPGSHHWVLSNPLIDAEKATDPAFGAWTCRGGAAQGQACDPLQLDACGADGLCASELKDAIACIGFGPSIPGSAGLLSEGLIENVQAANQYLPPREGVYRELPIRGFLYHNTHGFNLTKQDHTLHARLNVYFARDRRRRMEQVIDYSRVFMAAGIPPYTTKDICADYVAPPGAEMIRLTSHTHKRGKRFWMTLPNGEMIYESTSYSDPLYKEYDPPILFNGATAAERTFRACATYNNGVSESHSPDPETVTRYSRLPDRTQCTPVACTAGKVGAPCKGHEDGATCDLSPGSGDGVCDACPITGGPTTEDEMFVVMPSYILPEGR